MEGVADGRVLVPGVPLLDRRGVLATKLRKSVLFMTVDIFEQCDIANMLVGGLRGLIGRAGGAGSSISACYLRD